MKTSTLLWDTSQYSLVLICNAILAGNEVQQQVWKSFQLSFTLMWFMSAHAKQFKSEIGKMSYLYNHTI